MEMKPGFKLTEVGVIPEDWRTPALSRLTVLMTNGFVGTATTHYASNENGVLYIQGYNVEENAFNFHGIKFVTEDFHRAHMKSCLRSGDLLTVQTGEAGLTTIVPESLAGSNCHALIISRFDQKQVFPAFISYYLNSKPGRSRLRLIETGTTMKHLNVGDVLQFVVPLPPTKAEQEAITEVLADTDALIESIERLLAKKRHVKQGAMQELLTGKKRLPGFKVEWQEQALFDLAGGRKELFDDGDWIESEHITDQGIRLVQTGNIGVGSFIERDEKKYIFEKSFVSLRCKEIRQGDLLICRLADPAGRSCILPNIGEAKIITSVDVTIFRPPAAVANRAFLANMFSTDKWFRAVGDRSGGTTHKRISRGALGRLRIKVPLVEEQAAIAAVLSDMDAEIAALQAKLAKARNLKRGMMQELLTGRIRLI
jgi:type I restriction enzyme S subunit